MSDVLRHIYIEFKVPLVHCRHTTYVVVYIHVQLSSMLAILGYVIVDILDFAIILLSIHVLSYRRF